MEFTAKDVQKLREKTGVGIMDCKKAMVECDGNMEAAIEFLREKGLAAAEKKSSRIAAEGIVLGYKDDKAGAIIEVNSETDFVAKNVEFQNFVTECAKTVACQNPADIDALLALKPEGSNYTVQELLQEKVLKIGENLKIRRFQRYEGATHIYVHGGGRIGVLAKFEVSGNIAGKPEFEETAKDVTMQIAALNPQYNKKEDVTADILEKEKKIMTEQAINEGKPREIAEKIVMGKISKYYKENCLTEQEFFKNGDISVGQHVEAQAKLLGGSITVSSFVRFEKGEGLQKREDDFAAEVASMMK